MRIALAQINPTVGDLAGNARKVLEYIEKAQSVGASVVVFPELALCGYPPRDLLLNPGFLQESDRALEQVAAQVSGIEVLLGYAHPSRRPGGLPTSSVALLRDGKVWGCQDKTILSSDEILDERRYFEPGRSDPSRRIIAIAGHCVGLSVGEEVVEDIEGCDSFAPDGAEVLIHVSAAPFISGVHEARLARFAQLARRLSRPLVYVNQVGGNDELIFDGNSFALDAGGSVVAQARDFAEDLLLVELPAVEPLDATPEFSRPSIGELDRMAPGRREIPSRGIESIHHALVLGLGDYVRKSGFRSVILGLSGGIDSALVAALAAAALGGENVHGVGLPSRYSTPHSLTDARQLADNLGMPFQVIPIESVHAAFDAALRPVLGAQGADTTDENIQARARGMILMALSNKFNHLLLTTSNKSELAVGYCTLYGDMCGGLAGLADVPKSMVYELSNFINHHAGREVIPWNTITKPPSAELRPDQTDQDSLPPYEVLDPLLHRYVELGQDAGQIIEAGFDPAVVMRITRLVDRAEFKRRQAAPVLRISQRPFGLGGRLPMAQNYTPGALDAGILSTP